MSTLHACSNCRRHIRGDESSCPFCGETAAVTSGRGPVRAALFAGVLAGATVAGCGDAKPAVEDPSHKVDPGPADSSDAMAAAPVEGEREFAKDPDEEEVSPPPPPRDDVPPMPYGAPPMRHRLV